MTGNVWTGTYWGYKVDDVVFDISWTSWNNRVFGYEALKKLMAQRGQRVDCRVLTTANHVPKYMENARKTHPHIEVSFELNLDHSASLGSNTYYNLFLRMRTEDEITAIERFEAAAAEKKAQEKRAKKLAKKKAKKLSVKDHSDFSKPLLWGHLRSGYTVEGSTHHFPTNSKKLLYLAIGDKTMADGSVIPAYYVGITVQRLSERHQNHMRGYRDSVYDFDFKRYYAWELPDHWSRTPNDREEMEATENMLIYGLIKTIWGKKFYLGNSNVRSDIYLNSDGIEEVLSFLEEKVYGKVSQILGLPFKKEPAPTQRGSSDYYVYHNGKRGPVNWKYEVYRLLTVQRYWIRDNSDKTIDDYWEDMSYADYVAKAFY